MMVVRWSTKTSGTSRAPKPGGGVKSSEVKNGEDVLNLSSDMFCKGKRCEQQRKTSTLLLKTADGHGNSPWLFSGHSGVYIRCKVEKGWHIQVVTSTMTVSWAQMLFTVDSDVKRKIELVSSHDSVLVTMWYVTIFLNQDHKSAAHCRWSQNTGES